MAVYNFGSINIDYIYKVDHFVAPGETLSSTDFSAVLGGKGANQSVALARAGATAVHIGGAGKSDQSLINQMADSGVDMQHVKLFADIASGHAIIQITPDAENAIILYAGANHTLTTTRIAEALDGAKTDDWVLLQNETNCIGEIIELSHAKGLKVAYNPAPMQNFVSDLPLDQISMLIVNEVEAMQMTSTNAISDAKNALSTRYPDLQIVLTLGKEGALCLQNSQQVACSAYSVDAVDTTAAGDTFIGYLLAQLQQRHTIEQAMSFACAASALTVTKMGAVPSIPTADEVNRFLERQKA